MAYAFDAVNKLVNNGQDQTNIFGSPQGTPVSQDQTAPSGDVKTSTEGDSTPSGGGSSSGGNQAPINASNVDLSGDQSTRDAYKANAGKTSQPKVFNDIQSQIQANQEKLQKESDDYLAKGQQAQAQSNAYTDQDIEKGISGDQASADKLRTELNRTSAPVDAFQGPDTYVPDTSLLTSKAGLQSLVSRGQDENYTPGMAAFDLGALQKAPNFQSLLSGIQGKASELGKRQAELQGSQTAALQSYADKSLQDAQAGLKSSLSSRSDAINAANNKEAADANAHLADIRAHGSPTDAAAFLASLTPAVKATLQQSNPSAVSYLKPQGIDPLAYQTVRDDYNAKDFVSPEEAQRFNAIMGLMGGSDMLQASGDVGPAVSYDRTRAGNDLVTGATGEAKKAQIAADKVKADADAKAKAVADAYARIHGKQAQMAGLSATALANGTQQKAVDDQAFEQQKGTSIAKMLGQATSFGKPSAGKITPKGLSPAAIAPAKLTAAQQAELDKNKKASSINTNFKAVNFAKKNS